jgi:hypothetical protein
MFKKFYILSAKQDTYSAKMKGKLTILNTVSTGN